MAADASVFNALLRPVRTSAEIENERTTNALNQLKLQDAQRTSAQNALIQQQQADERNALQRIASGWAADTTPDQRVAALRNSGLPGLMTQADALEKGYLDRRKTEADVGKTNAEALGKNLEAMKFFANSVAANPTPQNASLAIDAFEKLTGYKLDGDRQAISALQSPDDIKRWALGHALSADKLLPQIQNLNLGGKQITQAVDPITGRPTVTGSQMMTQSPDNIANNATSRANNAATVGASLANAAALREQAQATRDAAQIQSGFKNETELRKEFEGLPEVKNYKQAFPAYAAIKDAASRNTPQADINLVYGIAKLYDPTSVVREGEYATVANSPNIPERIKGYAQYLAGGGKLSPQVKAEILQEAQGRLSSYENEVDKAAQSYSGIAQQRGMNPASVFQAVGNFEAGGKRKAQAASPGAPKQVKTDADYDALPSGSVFVGPDGKTRRKP